VLHGGSLGDAGGGSTADAATDTTLLVGLALELPQALVDAQADSVMKTSNVNPLFKGRLPLADGEHDVGSDTTHVGAKAFMATSPVAGGPLGLGSPVDENSDKGGHGDGSITGSGYKELVVAVVSAVDELAKGKGL
jgi:hypothetical protein